MPQGQVLVTRESMLQARARFEQAIATLQQLRSQVDAAVAGLVGPAWGGTTANQFGMVMREWDDQYRIVQQQLAAMTENLARNTGVYDAGDEAAHGQTNALGNAVRA